MTGWIAVLRAGSTLRAYGKGRNWVFRSTDLSRRTKREKLRKIHLPALLINKKKWIGGEGGEEERKEEEIWVEMVEREEVCEVQKDEEDKERDI